jgi:voltage-gated potassium channel
MPDHMADNSGDEQDEQTLLLERWRLLHQIENLLDRPMIVLAFVWLGLLVIDLTTGLNRPLQIVSLVIWGIFGFNFLISFIIAPSKGLYMRRNWLVGLSLLLPAFGVLRVFRVVRLLRVARTVRTLGLLRLVTSLNRSMRALGSALGRRGVGFVALLTVLVIFAGAAGILFFEGPATDLANGGGSAGTDSGIDSYAAAVWWTAMLMTTIGTEHWPQTGEGRLLMWLLSVYALAVFGYLTGTLASYFVGVDREHEEASPTGSRRQVAALQAEISELRKQLAAQTGPPQAPPTVPPD